MNKKINSLIIELERTINIIEDKRRKELYSIASILTDNLKSKGHIDIIIICTHNSRRSQLAQLWLNIGLLHHDIKGIHNYSGGTEATAFNIRMVDALRRAGFDLASNNKGNNPNYQLIDDGKSIGVPYFSKTFDTNLNPQTEYMAIMVCNNADENCPVVHGMRYRKSLPYIDPKAADNTPNEATVYDEKVIEIGREMLYLVKAIKTLLP